MRRGVLSCIRTHHPSFLFLLLSLLAAGCAVEFRQPPPRTATHGDTPSCSIAAYDEVVAKVMAEYCAAAYSCGSLEGCGNWSCNSCQLHSHAEAFRFSGGVNGTGVSGLVVHDSDINKIILVFAGTQPGDLAAWANNLNGELTGYTPCADAGCQVHTGFYADYQALAPAFLEPLSYALARFPRASLWVTGHSLGGALAMLAVADLKGNHAVRIEALYTYGQPRVGNQAFAMNFIGLTRRQDAPTSYYRVVHAQDPIPHVPPILLGFWHAPTEVFYNEEQTKYELCDDTGEDFYCSNSFLFAFKVDDHFNYLGVPL